MIYSPDAGHFISKNYSEIRKLVQSISNRYKNVDVDDVSQEFCTALLEKNFLKKYDPNHPSGTKISTYLYRNINNILRDHVKSNEGKIEKGSLYVQRYIPGEDYREPYDMTGLAVDYEAVISRNDSSDKLDGINLDLNLFELYLKKNDKYYCLKRSRNRCKDPRGMSISKVFQYMRQGLNHREISEIFGVSIMFISNVKNEIKNRMRKFGLAFNRYKAKQPTKRRRSRKKIICAEI